MLSLVLLNILWVTKEGWEVSSGDVLAAGRGRPLEPRWGCALTAKTLRRLKNREALVIAVGSFRPRVQGLPQLSRHTWGHPRPPDTSSTQSFHPWLGGTGWLLGSHFPGVTSHPFLFGAPQGRWLLILSIKWALPGQSCASLTGGGPYPSLILHLSHCVAPSSFTGSPAGGLGL